MNADSLNDVETAARDLRAAVSRRDQAIRRARADGWSFREIAYAAGVSPQTVVNITNKEDQT